MGRWIDGPGVHPGCAAPAVGQGALRPDLGGLGRSGGQVFGLGQHYAMALLDRALDAGKMIERQSSAFAALRLENEELRRSSGPEVVAAAEQRASALEEEVRRLRAELEESQARARTLDDELQTLSNDIESARSSAWAAEEALKEEQRALPERLERAVVEYKASASFECGLVTSGRVTYEFGYRVACARARSTHPEWELEPDPFADHPADDGVDMPGSVPFDDGPETPPPS
ncbi:uncharacterized protein LOC135616189 [Musa acuminata AAA Group]|uniref:uncharacterized protein LOC135616189 n=1 Tax=Musa acuminata AAA Group TaxID=214697 RepID=UPI0031E024E1